MARSRGKPDGPAWGVYGKRSTLFEVEVVHFMKSVEGTPLCNNGAYNLRYSDNPKKVTCPKCKERLKT